MKRGSKSKIAQLPQELREEIGRRLQEGLAYDQIAGWLAENGHPGIRKDLISKWFLNEHQKWVRQQMWKQIEADEKAGKKG